MENNIDPSSKNETSQDENPSMSGGFFIALGTLLGFAAGIYLGEISAGTIAGFGLGIAIAIIIWLYDRKKT